MSGNVDNMLSEYLERVKVYLPLDGDDLLTEIKTHLLQTAEEIGDGEITPGSLLMAIERFGEPKRVANEYAGTKKEYGVIPTEYVIPLKRILAVLLTASIAFILGSYIVGVSFDWLFQIQIQPFDLAIMGTINGVIILLVLGGLYPNDREKSLTEKTTVEEFLFLGREAFKPKAYWDAYADGVFGILGGILLILPQVQAIFSPYFLPFLSILVGLSFFNAANGLLFALGGENNLNLVFEAVLRIFWILLAVVIVNVGWPLWSVWTYSTETGMWYLINLQGVFEIFIFNILWTIAIFLSVIFSAWRVIVNSIKVSMHMKSGKRLWWHGQLDGRKGRTTPLLGENQGVVNTQ